MVLGRVDRELLLISTINYILSISTWHDVMYSYNHRCKFACMFYVFAFAVSFFSFLFFFFFPLLSFCFCIIILINININSISVFFIIIIFFFFSSTFQSPPTLSEKHRRILHFSHFRTRERRKIHVTLRHVGGRKTGPSSCQQAGRVMDHGPA